MFLRKYDIIFAKKARVRRLPYQNYYACIEEFGYGRRHMRALATKNYEVIFGLLVLFMI